MSAIAEEINVSNAPEIKTIRLSEVVFDEAIYPRKEHDPALVQRYADTLDAIEAAGRHICVSADMRLLDGKHRWLAYRTKYQDDADKEIAALVYPVNADHEAFALAVELNSQHGYQLTTEDKKQCAISLYSHGYTYDTIAAKLSVGKSRISDWLSRTVKEQKDRQNTKLMELWLACKTQEEIAEAVGLQRATVDRRINGEGNDHGLLEKYRQNQSSKITFADDFTPPIYNIWKQQEKSNSVSHFGNSEARWVENLLYLYTEPFDVVVDPFAGGGSTIDVCKRRGRRYFASDRKPITAREHEIRKHDLTDGLPSLPRWKDVRLIYLDPPYWRQSEGQYSNDPSDLANMSLEQFNETLAGIINAFAKKLKNGEPRYIALIIQPTQWKAPERVFTDHVGDMLRLVKLPVDMRFSVPYESQQCTAQMVDWAKENRRCLVLTREIVVWRV